MTQEERVEILCSWTWL